jgi:VWFA-related protein
MRSIRRIWPATLLLLFVCAPQFCRQPREQSPQPSGKSDAIKSSTPGIVPAAATNPVDAGVQSVPGTTPAGAAISPPAQGAEILPGPASAAGASAYKIQVRTRLILVPALVNDSKGNFISGLKPKDFTIRDNGKVQPVKVLEEIVAPPAEELAKTALPPGTYSNNVVTPKAPLRVVIILFDMLNSHFKDQVPARIQLTKYLRTQIAPGTMVALLGLGRGGLRMYHDLTSDTQGLGTELEMAMNSGRHSISTNLQDEMSETESNEAFVGHGAFAQTGSHGRSDRKFIILDTLAAFKNIAGAYASLPGRKSLIWVTGGFPFEIDGSKSTSDGMPALDKDSLMDILDDYQSTWQTLADANIALYPVDMHGLMTTSMPDASYQGKRGGNAQAALGKFENQKQTRNEDNINTMVTFANQTGGKAFYNDNDLVTGFKQAVDDTRSSYMLGYYLGEDAAPGWHKLHVDVNHAGAHVRARTGFLVNKVDPTHPDPHGKDPGSIDVDLAMESPMNFTAIPMTVRWIDNGQVPTAAAPSAGLVAKRKVAFQITLPPHAATIDDIAGQHKVSLNFVALARTPQGDDAVDFVKKIDGALKPEVARQLDMGGVKFDSTVVLAPGYYNVRFIVRDNLSGKVGSVTAPLVVK